MAARGRKTGQAFNTDGVHQHKDSEAADALVI